MVSALICNASYELSAWIYCICILMFSVYLCTSFISTRHHLISETLSPQQHQSVLVAVRLRSASSHEWDSNLVSTVSHMLHQPPGTLYHHHCNNSLTLTHLNARKNCCVSTSLFLAYYPVFIFYFIQWTLCHFYSLLLLYTTAFGLCVTLCVSGLCYDYDLWLWFYFHYRYFRSHLVSIFTWCSVSVSSFGNAVNGWLDKMDQT